LSYIGATTIKIGHDSLKPGDGCPKCQKGKVYASVAPRRLVRIVGQAPLGAKVYEMESLRCNLCLEVFTAKTPEGVGEKKYDETSGSMISILKYGTGFPFYRLEHLQGNLGIPLPASTQWEIVQEVAGIVEPARRELIRQAAQGELLHNDDTTMKILALMKEANANSKDADSGERTGIFTSGIVSIFAGRKIALFFTGHKHAGENAYSGRCCPAIPIDVVHPFHSMLSTYSGRSCPLIPIDVVHFFGNPGMLDNLTERWTT